ncbi:MAG: UDP-N-acetylmuramoyl-tripeptide--D-alanyl-D-alanine ligase [Deltaproteobacteria bacterium]|nr:UDP-N-acetylmuramoyl-tripeptide--D-alanyl-D-alanine ligase [Deltaproteobacteria bacterium]MBW2361455.1 UDP-N-acetylmuramoyl-tripeptide--D-alanyl-D-alanine ligase [Deltaproteobacteria bacterium]
MTVPFSVAELVGWTQGRLSSGNADVQLKAVSTDTRTLSAGALFIAIRGPHHDAHDHLAAALEAGAAALLIERSTTATEDCNVPVIVVSDTTAALGALAAGHRNAFKGPVVGITGSNGKTTTKEMCAAILSLRGPCLKNRGNLNNAYGLPLTLLEREAAHEALVVELGMNHRGEIAPLAAIARPTIGVITNVGSAHIEHLGSQEEIAEEKGDLIAALPAEGVAVLNADDPRVMAQAPRTPAPILRFGKEQTADVRAENIRTTEAGGFAFDLVTAEGIVEAGRWPAVVAGLVEAGRWPAVVAGLGEPTVINALAAAAAAFAAGAAPETVVRGLAAYAGVSGRMARIALPGGVVVIDDTYNANPQSMEAALRSLVNRSRGGRAFAVLGSMGELGPASEAAHRELGRLAGELGVAALSSYGEHAETLAEGAISGGLSVADVCVAKTHEELAAHLSPRLRSGDWVLVKGSRAMAMENVVALLSNPKDET